MTGQDLEPPSSYGLAPLLTYIHPQRGAGLCSPVQGLPGTIQATENGVPPAGQCERPRGLKEGEAFLVLTRKAGRGNVKRLFRWLCLPDRVARGATDSYS